MDNGKWIVEYEGSNYHLSIIIYSLSAIRFLKHP